VREHVQPPAPTLCKDINVDNSARLPPVLHGKQKFVDTAGRGREVPGKFGGDYFKKAKK